MSNLSRFLSMRRYTTLLHHFRKCGAPHTATDQWLRVKQGFHSHCEQELICLMVPVRLLMGRISGLNCLMAKKTECRQEGEWLAKTGLGRREGELRESGFLLSDMDNTVPERICIRLQERHGTSCCFQAGTKIYSLRNMAQTNYKTNRNK